MGGSVPPKRMPSGILGSCPPLYSSVLMMTQVALHQHFLAALCPHWGPWQMSPFRDRGLCIRQDFHWCLSKANPCAWLCWVLWVPGRINCNHHQPRALWGPMPVCRRRELCLCMCRHMGRPRPRPCLHLLGNTRHPSARGLTASEQSPVLDGWHKGVL